MGQRQEPPPGRARGTPRGLLAAVGVAEVRGLRRLRCAGAGYLRVWEVTCATQAKAGLPPLTLLPPPGLPGPGCPGIAGDFTAIGSAEGCGGCDALGPCAGALRRPRRSGVAGSGAPWVCQVLRVAIGNAEGPGGGRPWAVRWGERPTGACCRCPALLSGLPKRGRRGTCGGHA